MFKVFGGQGQTFRTACSMTDWLKKSVGTLPKSISCLHSRGVGLNPADRFCSTIPVEVFCANWTWGQISSSCGITCSFSPVQGTSRWSATTWWTRIICCCVHSTSSSPTLWCATPGKTCSTQTSEVTRSAHRPPHTFNIGRKTRLWSFRFEAGTSIHSRHLASDRSTLFNFICCGSISQLGFQSKSCKKMFQ